MKIPGSWRSLRPFSSGGGLTISFTGNFLKILLMKGNLVQQWSLTPFNPNLVRGDVVVEAAGLGQIIRAATTRMGAQNRKAVAAFPGSRAIPRIMALPVGRDIYPGDFIPRQARRTFGAVADNSYLYWHFLRKDRTQQLFYVLAVPRDAVDSFAEALRFGGFRPYKIELTSMALARAVQTPTAVLVNLDTTAVEIVVVVDHAPMLMYSEALTEMAGAGLATALTEQLQRVIPFHNERNRDRPLPANAPIYISGFLPVDQETTKAVEASMGNPVSIPTPPPFSYPADFQSGTFMVNLGLALKDKS